MILITVLGITAPYIHSRPRNNTGIISFPHKQNRFKIILNILKDFIVVSEAHESKYVVLLVTGHLLVIRKSD